MRKGLFLPYGCAMLPIGSTLAMAQPNLFPLIGAGRILSLYAVTLIMGTGFVESFYAYDIIKEARAASVQRTKNVLRASFYLFAISFAFWIGPLLIDRVFSIETPFADTLEWIGTGAFLLSTFPIGGASLVVLDRWSSRYPEELGIPYWTRPTRWERVYWIGWFVVAAGFFLIAWVPLAALVLLSTGAAVLLAGPLLNRRPKAQPEGGNDASLSKIELRKVGYKEKLATAKRVSELIRKKLGSRVFAIYMPGDEAENSQYPYAGINILVVVRDGVNLPSEHYVFEGILVKISYWQEIFILHRAKSFDDDWPWHSDFFRRRIVLYEKKQWLGKLDRAAEQSDIADPADALRESALDLLQNLADLRDDQTRGDAVGVRIDCWRAGWVAVSLVYLINRKYSKSDYWKEVFECAVQPSDFRRRLETILGLTPSSQDNMAESTEKLCEELLEMVRSRGIAIASSKLRA